MSIDVKNYSALSTFSILAGTEISAGGPTGSLTTNALYGCSPPATYVGVFDPASPALPADVAIAQGELTNLINDLDAAIASEGTGINVISSTVSSEVTLTSGVHKAVGLTFDTGSSIVLDITGSTDPFFVIYSTSFIDFTNFGGITVVGGPDVSRIFFYSEKAINISNLPVIACTFVTKTSINFLDESHNVKGFIFAKDAVLFDTALTVSTPRVTPPEEEVIETIDICFPGYTPINTDQGSICIDKLIPGIHTINNKEIVDVTKTVAKDTFLVLFKKDSLAPNTPSQDTIISKYHGVEYKGEMFEAFKLVDIIENVVKEEYTGQVMYNILMNEHEKILVNNMTCETLRPDHPFAMKWTTRSVNKRLVQNVPVVSA